MKGNDVLITSDKLALYLCVSIISYGMNERFLIWGLRGKRRLCVCVEGSIPRLIVNFSVQVVVKELVQ